MRGARGAWIALGLATLACRRAPSSCPGGALLAVEAPRAPVGFDAPFTLVATPLCEAARAGTITWTQTSGPLASGLAPDDGGRTLRARSPTLADALGGAPPWGVIPLSPRTRGELAFEATWRDGRGVEERHEVTVAAAPRARGLASTAVGARVYLGPAGGAWRLDARPAASATTLAPTSGAASLVPDVAGDYRLVDGAGRALTLRAARYDETPLDCARSGCHPSESKAAAASAMTTVLARGLAPASPAPGAPATFGAAYPACALACHATGEPGCADGGFTDVMGELGMSALAARPWDEVPRALRRLGGVGCLACHGPGALPETSARWAILRTDVCATCHDAPPRYGHVVAWRSTAMARADRDPRTRDGACARCHTAAGALARFVGGPDRRAPEQIAPFGLACAVCHAPHDPAAQPGATALLRSPPPSEALGPAPSSASKSGVCLSCHAPAAGETVTASAAPLWLGREGVDPATGAPLPGPAPHAAIAGGCVGCHREGPPDLERGASHAFVARRGDCRACHAASALDAGAGVDIRPRALALWAAARARLGDGPAAGPPHATSRRPDLETPLGRAAWDVALVVEDPAASAHNPTYARMLLAAAEKVINRQEPK